MTRRVLPVFLVLLGLVFATAGGAQTPTAAALFDAATGDLAVGAPSSQTPSAGQTPTPRARATGVRMSALDSDRLALPLFPDVAIEADLTSRQQHEDGTLVWSGRVNGDPLGSATFVQAGDVLQGSIRLADQAYSIEPIAGTAFHAIRQVSTAPPGVELPPLVPSAERLLRPLADIGPLGDDGSTVDVLVVYTAQARAAAGGTDAAIRARIQLGIAETNAAYNNSGVIQRVRLVGSELVGYVESGNLYYDLQLLTETTDGQMDIVHGRRNGVGADLVSLIVGSTGTGSCGVAWLMQAPTVAFAPVAFSVTAYPCISPNYTFGHELAHNMGSTHAPDDGSSPPDPPAPPLPGAYEYSYGYKDPADLFRTIMAYNCRVVSCPRLLHFSNPGVTVSGRPTGTTLQNNALSLNNTRAVVANFRQAVPSATLLGQPDGFSVQTSGTTALFTWAPPPTGEPTAYVLEAGTGEGFANLATLTLGAGERSLVVPAIAPGTYFVRVRAVNAAGPGPASSEIVLQMTPAGRCVALPGAPLLSAPLVSGNTVMVSWSAPTSGGPADSYLLGAGSRPDALDLAVIEVGPGTAFTTVAADGLYFLRVAARNACGIGAASNEVSVRVGPPPPGPPIGLSYTVAPDGVVTISWQAPVSGGTPGSYVIEAGTIFGLTDIGSFTSPGPGTTATTTAPAGRYFVRVRGTNVAGTGPPSDDLEIIVPLP